MSLTTKTEAIVKLDQINNKVECRVPVFLEAVMDFIEEKLEVIEVGKGLNMRKKEVIEVFFKVNMPSKLRKPWFR